MGSVVSTLTELSLLTTILILETSSEKGVVEMYVYNRITMSIHWTISGGVFFFTAWLPGEVEDHFDCEGQSVMMCA